MFRRSIHQIIALFALCAPHAAVLADSPNLLMTEIADPKDSWEARFVELYSDNGAGQAVGQYNGKHIYLTLTSNANTDFNANVLLTGTIIGSDGFLVICKSMTVFGSSYGSKTCDLESSSVINSNGDDSFVVSCWHVMFFCIESCIVSFDSFFFITSTKNQLTYFFFSIPPCVLTSSLQLTISMEDSMQLK